MWQRITDLLAIANYSQIIWRSLILIYFLNFYHPFPGALIVSQLRWLTTEMKNINKTKPCTIFDFPNGDTAGKSLR